MTIMTPSLRRNYVAPLYFLATLYLKKSQVYTLYIPHLYRL
jgi:hypothetical protein